MSRLLARLSTLLFGLFVLGGLAFGASTALGVSSLEECGDDLGELGTCPPITPQECPDLCIEEGFFGGDCINQGGQDCCVCLT